MGADYMLIPLMAAEQFGVNSLPRAMAIILPANTISQTGFPALTAFLQQYFGSYTIPMYIVFAVGILSGISIALLPRKEKEPVEEALHIQDARGAASSALNRSERSHVRFEARPGAGARHPGAPGAGGPVHGGQLHRESTRWRVATANSTGVPAS